jgi:NADH:ubiquinone oxidoreductase subunit 6 (subunit J)
MTDSYIVFFLVAATALASVLITFMRALFNAALALLVCLISLAGLFALLNAEFVAITQVLIYAGGILVLILFGIMLTQRISGQPPMTETHHAFTGAVVAGGLLFLLINAIAGEPLLNQPLTEAGTEKHIQQIGMELMTTYAAPFELAGLLLLVCIIGAAMTASSFTKSHE